MHKHGVETWRLQGPDTEHLLFFFQQINIWNQNVFLFINSNKKGLGEISKKYFNLRVEDYFVGYKT